MNTEEICATIQRAVSDYMRRTPAHLRDCDAMTGRIVAYLRAVIPASSTVELPPEPTPAIINAMERMFYGDAAIDSITGPDDPQAHSQWKIWSEVYRAILEAAK